MTLFAAAFDALASDEELFDDDHFSGGAAGGGGGARGARARSGDDDDDDDDDASRTVGGGGETERDLGPLIIDLNRLADFFQIATHDDEANYVDDDPLDRTVRVFRSLVGTDRNWLGNGEVVAQNMFTLFVDIWGLYQEFCTVCGGDEHVPVEYRRRFERMYETLHHMRDMLHRMRRVSLLRAPESAFLEQNNSLAEAVRVSKKGRSHADFQMLATCWDCECNASFGVGHEVEDNTNPFRHRPIGLGEEAMDALGKHVRWTWNPPSTSTKDIKPFQRFVIYLLEQARLRGFRRYGKSIYERIVTTAGRYTPAWRRVCHIGEFVRGEVINRGCNFTNWCDATCEKGNISSAIDYLENCLDPSLPVLIKSRRFYAYSNGVYVTYIKHHGQVMDYFWNYNDPHGIPVANAGDFGAVKYFDRACRFADYEHGDWFAIPTPALTGIMQYQDLDEDVQKWHWALLGRLFHNVGELDSWQICFFLRGVAQSGKSSIILFWKTFYEVEDVGTIANNIENTFGWSVMAEKLVCLGPELRTDFVKNVDQATLQSIISGEIVSLAVKNKDPVTLTWQSPLFLVGNDELIFNDSSGQVARRIASIEYMKKVLNVDASLPAQLDQERDLVMIKANRAYLAAVNEVGTGEVWGKLPAYFKRIQAAGFELNNSIAHFLAHGNLVYGTTKRMPHRLFMKLYNTHCTTFGLTKLPWRKMNVVTVMNQRNIRVSDHVEQADWNGASVSDIFLHGVDVPDASIMDISALF
jgi:hypothetical protein